MPNRPKEIFEIEARLSEVEALVKSLIYIGENIDHPNLMTLHGSVITLLYMMKDAVTRCQQAVTDLIKNTAGTSCEKTFSHSLSHLACSRFIPDEQSKITD